jgi:hypothetical protein
LDNLDGARDRAAWRVPHSSASKRPSLIDCGIFHSLMRRPPARIAGGRFVSKIWITIMERRTWAASIVSQIGTRFEVPIRHLKRRNLTGNFGILENRGLPSSDGL